jgi:predicted dehydrogenase
MKIVHKAGKHIYCEKGWTRSIAEAKAMREAVRRNKVVHQLGHQARASHCGAQAAGIVELGLLGPITLVRTGRFGNTPRGRNTWRWYGYYDRWTRPDPGQVVKDVDWERWLGPAEKRPFDAADLVNLLRRQGCEVHTATEALKTKDGDFPSAAMSCAWISLIRAWRTCFWTPSTSTSASLAPTMIPAGLSAR